MCRCCFGYLRRKEWRSSPRLPPLFLFVGKLAGYAGIMDNNNRTEELPGYCSGMVCQLLEKSRNIALQVNIELLTTYWNIDRYGS